MARVGQCVYYLYRGSDMPVWARRLADPACTAARQTICIPENQPIRVRLSVGDDRRSNDVAAFLTPARRIKSRVIWRRIRQPQPVFCFYTIVVTPRDRRTIAVSVGVVEEPAGFMVKVGCCSGIW